MRVCCLFSGGKDSTYALHWAVLKGFQIACLLTIRPSSPDSMLFHYPAVEPTRLQAEAMGMEHVIIDAGSREEEALRAAFHLASMEYGAEGIVSGALLSDYQRLRFSMAAEDAGIKSYTPLWRIDQRRYMLGLPEEGFEFIVTRVSAMGLPPDILGRPLGAEDVARLVRLAEAYGFNPAFEGGEAETLVVDAPLFRHRLVVRGHVEKEAEDVWSFRITEARLASKDAGRGNL